MKKKYISPLFAELELVLEDVLFDSDVDNQWSVENSGSDDNGFGDFDGEDDDFNF